MARRDMHTALVTKDAEVSDLTDRLHAAEVRAVEQEAKASALEASIPDLLAAERVKCERAT